MARLLIKKRCRNALDIKSHAISLNISNVSTIRISHEFSEKFVYTEEPSRSIWFEDKDGNAIMLVHVHGENLQIIREYCDSRHR